MKWEAPKTPTPGDVRVVRKYAILPTRVRSGTGQDPDKDIVILWEHYYEIQEYWRLFADRGRAYFMWKASSRTEEDPTGVLE